MVRYNYLTEYVRRIKAQNILEIGTYNGGNSLAMIAAAFEANKFEEVNEVVYWGFDLWEDLTPELFKLEVSKKPSSYEAISFKFQNSTRAHVRLIKGNTRETIPKFVADNPGLSIDLIFVDGGHSFGTVESDWKWISELVGEQTVVLFDDYWVHDDGKTEIGFGCKRVIDSLDRDKWNVTILPKVDPIPERHARIHFVEVTKK